MKIEVDITDAQNAAMLAAGLDPTAHLQGHASYQADLVVERVEGDHFEAVGLPRALKKILTDPDQVAFVVADAEAKKAAKDAAAAAAWAAEQIAAQIAADEAAAAAAAAGGNP